MQLISVSFQQGVIVVVNVAVSVTMCCNDDYGSMTVAKKNYRQLTRDRTSIVAMIINCLPRC